MLLLENLMKSIEYCITNTELYFVHVWAFSSFYFKRCFAKGLNIQCIAKLMSLLTGATEGSRDLEMIAFTFWVCRRIHEVRLKRWAAPLQCSDLQIENGSQTVLFPSLMPERLAVCCGGCEHGDEGVLPWLVVLHRRLQESKKDLYKVGHKLSAGE